MRIMYCDFDETWHADILDKLSEKLNADYIVSLSCVDHKLDKPGREYIWIDNDALNYHQYDKYAHLDLPTLDAELLEKLTWCESLYMPMLDRSELVMSKTLTYQERRQCYYYDLRIMLYYLQSVDVCLFSNIPHVAFDFALFGLCKALDIPYAIQYFCSPIPGHTSTFYIMQDIYDHIPQMNNIKYDKNEENIKLSPRMQAYFDYYGRDKKEIKQLIRVTSFNIEDKKDISPSKLDMVLERYRKGLLWATINRKINNLFVTRREKAYYKKNCYTPQKEKYIYCALHYQPECTSLPMGGVYNDQELMIAQLSKIVPEGVKIYVKPHPHRSWFADETFYERLNSYHNVCLIKPEYNSYDLIDSAVAVATLTGTTILEAIIRGVPALMFGYNVWQYAPGVFHCRTNKDVKEAINTIMSGNYVINEKHMRVFFNELDKYVTDGSLVRLVNEICNLSIETSVNNAVDIYSEYIRKMGLEFD